METVLPIDSIIHGDALEILKNIPDCSIDAICTDPPSSINFMNMSWDNNKGGRTQWVSWLSSIMRECLRILKPGGHCLVWSLPRTSHWTALALEDAGFTIRDNIYNIVSGDTALLNFIASLSEEQQRAFMQIVDQQREPSGVLHVFGSGFPKSSRINRDGRFCHCETADNGVNTDLLKQQTSHNDTAIHQDDHSFSIAHSKLNTFPEPLKGDRKRMEDPLVEVANEVQNAHYERNTTQDSQVDYRYDCDLYDVSLHQEKEDDQASLPLQECVLTHSHSDALGDDQAFESSHSLSLVQHNDLPSNHDSAHLLISDSCTHGDTQPNIMRLGNNPTQTGNDTLKSHKSHKALQSLALNTPVFSYCTTCGKPKANGLGTALKPSVENWWLVRKPLAASSIAENVLQYGTGAINVDACRIDNPGAHGSDGRTVMDGWDAHGSSHLASLGAQRTPRNPQGRFPSHLLLSHTVFCIQVGTKRVQGHTPGNVEGSAKSAHPVYGEYQHHGSGIHYTNEDGMETVAAWQCVDSCPVKILDAQSGTRSLGHFPRSASNGGIWSNGKNPVLSNQSNNGYEDSGGASRYFAQFPALDDVPPYIYAGKASRKDRTADNTVHNIHPTVKSALGLMSYLVRLITPPNGIVLDCFAGSGSTLVAAIHEGLHFIGIEREAEYVAIAQKRIEHTLKITALQSTSTMQQDNTSLNHNVNLKNNIVHHKKRHKQQTSLQAALWDEALQQVSEVK